MPTVTVVGLDKNDGLYFTQANQSFVFTHVSRSKTVIKYQI